MGLLTDKIYKGLVEIQRLESEEYRNKKKHSEGLTASALPPYACRRSLWYTKKRIRQDEAYEPDPLLLSKFKDGKDAHEGLGSFFTSLGIKVIDREFSVNFKGIYARVDYKIKLDGKVYNLEFKTGSDDSFHTFCKYGTQAFPAYYGQAQVILGAQPQFPYIELMKNKNTSAYFDEIVEPNLEYQSNLEKMNAEFCNILLEDVPPERDFGYNSRECSGCEFRFKCWFSHLRADVLKESDLSPSEKKVVGYLLGILDTNMESYNTYLDADKEIRDVVAFLHTKHAVGKVKIDRVTSSAVETHRETPDTEYIRSILSEEQTKLAFRKKESKFFRTTIKFKEG